MKTDRPQHAVSKELLREKARLIRLETLRMTDICGSGHYGSSFSMAEIVAALYYRFMQVRANEPQWPDCDRFTMGKGHAAIGLFPVLADIGFFPQSWLDTYTRFKSPLGDHPDMKKVPGVDFSSGSIGHNLSVSVGMALGTRRRGSPSRTVCLMGDGEQTEGQIWEAAISAAHGKLDNLIGIVDIHAAGSDGNPQETAAALAVAHFGRIDILVNIAGITSPQRLMEVTPEMYSLVMDVNMRGTLYMTQAVVPTMREQQSGSIVNMSSVSAQRGGGVFGGSHYSAAKAAILGYTKAAARELGPDNIRVNAICPSFIDTDITAGMMTPERLESIVKSVPMGRPGHAHEVAGCVVFLASELSSYVTGSELDVNGGSHIH